MASIHPILLVDDDLALARTLTVAVETVGIPVEHCATAEVAIELLKTKRYGVLVVDLVLEAGLSGIYVVDAVRAMPAAERPAVLMITGANIENLRGINRDLVTAVIFKPLQFNLFAELVLATYRHSLDLRSDPGTIPSPQRVRTYCGGCGTEISPWVDRREPAEAHDERYEIWLDTPCGGCGMTPRLGGGRSETDM